MKNQAEDLAYWYFRFNGFFLLNNFVVHRTETTKDPSDIDILGIRHPYVYEAIGGQRNDWDPELMQYLDFSRMLGIIVEVKSGAYQLNDLFQKRFVKYALGRFGFIPFEGEAIEETSNQLDINPVVETENGILIAQILIAENPPRSTKNFFYLPLENTLSFIEQRINRYPEEKYRDRLFFDSNVIQTLIYQSRLMYKRGTVSP